MPLHVSSTCAHHQEVKIALHSFWYHHTYRCVMQFWPPDDGHMCSKHVEAWNKLIVKQKFCASSWLIIEINILRCTVSKTSKNTTNVASSVQHNFFTWLTVWRQLSDIGSMFRLLCKAIFRLLLQRYFMYNLQWLLKTRDIANCTSKHLWSTVLLTESQISDITVQLCSIY